MALPLRYRLASVLVGLNVVTIAVLAIFSYETSRRSLEQQALARAGAIADGRRQAVERLIDAHQRRLDGFLASVVSLCGERDSNGRLGLERECVRVAVAGLSETERATAVELRHRGRRVAVRGSWVPPAGEPLPSRPRAAIPSGRSAEYAMSAARGAVTLRARFSRRDLDDTLRDRSGLGENGQALLVDAAGGVLTATGERPASPAAGPQQAIADCLAGASGQSIGRDETTNQAVVVGFRPVAAIGGGCVVARIPYAEVLVPINRLGRQFLYASGGFVFLGVILSFIVAHAVAQPIARLVAAARAMEEGHFDQPAAPSGPAEVRTLQRTFARTATAIGHLIGREQAARLDAEAASRVKDDFLAALSHELRTPLNAILGWAAIASHRHASEARIVDALRAIERNARAQARLIDDLLDVSRIASGRLRLNRASVPLSSVVDAAIETIRPAADAKAIAMSKHVEASPTIVGDPQRLQQVVWNLLANAVRFTPERGRVDVRLCERGGYAEVDVTDTGSGIAPDFLPHVFEPFRQGDGGATRRHGGLGLGLTIVRQLIELHGGTVAAESAGHNRGATFTIRLPLRAEGATAAAKPSPGDHAMAELRGARVVIVEDDADARDILKTVLEDAGATVTAAASAEEARVATREVHPDLLIADIGMPGEDGYSLMRSIRATQVPGLASVPAIAVTAHALTEDVERALAAGFQMHLAKPVEPARLVAVAASLMTPADFQ